MAWQSHKLFREFQRGFSLPAGSLLNFDPVTKQGTTVSGWGAAALGRVGSGPATFKYGLCVRADGSAELLQPVAELTGEVTAPIAFVVDRVSFPAFIDQPLDEGTWDIGYCVKNDGAKDLNNNRYVAGWVMVVESE